MRCVILNFWESCILDSSPLAVLAGILVGLILVGCIFILVGAALSGIYCYISEWLKRGVE